MIGVGTIKEWVIMLDCNEPYISGLIFGHPVFPDNTLIFTSTIVGANGREVVTNSGSCYILEGPPNASLIKVFVDQFGPIDINEPLKDYCKNLQN